MQYGYASKKKNAKVNVKEVVVDTLKIDRARINKAPVVPFQDTLFYIYGNVGAVSAQQRALVITENIQELAKDRLFKDDSLHVVIEGDNYLIVYQNKTIIGITDQQAQILEKTEEEIAKEYRSIISEAVDNEIGANTWLVILKQVALSLLILAVTYFLIKFLNILYIKLRNFIKTKRDKAIKNIDYLLDADKQITFVLWLLKLARFMLIIFILYSCLLTFFMLFPETKWLSETLLGYITSPLKRAFIAIKNFIPDLFTIIVIIFIFRFLNKIIRTVAQKISEGSLTFKGFFPDWALPTYNILKIVLYIFMFILIFPHLPGSNSPIFQGVSVFMGILFSLGSTSVISNMVSGIVITYMRPFKVGDRIKMGEFMGNVIEKTPLVTRIKTPKNEVITIPNANIMTAQTINYTNSAKEYGLILYTTITVGYEISWRKVHELLIEAGLNTPNVLSDPKPFVLQIALDDFYVEYQINVFTREANEMANIYSDLNKNLQDVFNREGIELLSPHFRAQRDGSETMMPKEYVRPDNFRPQGFNVNVNTPQNNSKSPDKE